MSTATDLPNRRMLNMRLEQMEREMTALRSVMALSAAALQERVSFQKVAETQLKSAQDFGLDFGRLALGLKDAGDVAVLQKMVEAGVVPQESADALLRLAAKIDWVAPGVHERIKVRTWEVAAFRRHALAWMARTA